MHPNADRYVDLITSLPRPNGLLESSVPPLSRIKLEKRLKALTPEHQALLKKVEEILDWRQFKTGITEAQIIERGKKLFRCMKNKTLKEVVQERLELRTVVLALRMRNQGLKAPQRLHWGFGKWQQHIVRHWQDDDFHLSNVYTWIRKAKTLLQSNQSYELEKLILQISYQQLERRGGEHLFDFEAVVLYVMKWNIVNRSVQYNSHTALRRFDKILVTQHEKLGRLGI